MAFSLREKLDEVLVKSNLINQEKMKKALAIQKEKGGSLSQVLVDEGTITERELILVLSKELSIPPITLSKFEIAQDVLSNIPAKIARHYQIVPISKIGNTLTVAMYDPLNVFVMDDIRAFTGLKIEPVIASLQDIKQAIEKYYEQEEREFEYEDRELEYDIPDVQDEISITEVTKASREAPIVRMVNLVLAEALRRRASDIHIEPYQKNVRIRYRIDGNLAKVYSFPNKIKNALGARFKIMSRLDITERRLPQDGRFKAKIDGNEIDFRVSVLPVSHGEKIVLRILDKKNLGIGLDKLGFLPGELMTFQNAIKKPFGMILVTGPTGSGKSTTLYSVLNQITSRTKNIVTIEDPVEYQVEDITQVSVRPEIGLTFAQGLRSILRQSPDVIMVGEIRDSETADIAIKAALTGQLVLSTLHTNDASSAVTRMVDTGVEPFLIASAVILISAQRLLRKLCFDCREAYEPSRTVLEKLGLEGLDTKAARLYRARGCPRCQNTGYLGRTAVAENLVFDTVIKELVVKQASAGEIERVARSRGMKTLRENALENFVMGLTSLEEVLRVT